MNVQFTHAVADFLKPPVQHFIGGHWRSGAERSKPIQSGGLGKSHNGHERSRNHGATDERDELTPLHTAPERRRTDSNIEQWKGGGDSLMSASLIGRFGSSAFRRSTSTMSMSPAGSRFSPELVPRPFHYGIRERGGPIFWAALPQ